MSPTEYEREQARRRREQREAERQRRLDHQQAQEAEAARRNQQVSQWLAALDGLFAAAVQRGNLLDFEAMKAPLPRFAPGQLAQPEPRPDPDAFRAAQLRWYERLLPPKGAAAGALAARSRCVHGC
jgi:hypothetical protein